MLSEDESNTTISSRHPRSVEEGESWWSHLTNADVIPLLPKPSLGETQYTEMLSEEGRGNCRQDVNSGGVGVWRSARSLPLCEGGFGREYSVRKVTEIFFLGDKMSYRLCGSIYNAC